MSVPYWFFLHIPNTRIEINDLKDQAFCVLETQSASLPDSVRTKLQSLREWNPLLLTREISMRKEACMHLCFLKDDVQQVFPNNKIIEMPEEDFLDFIEGFFKYGQRYEIYSLTEKSDDTLLSMKHKDFLNLLFRLHKYIISWLNEMNEDLLELIVKIEDQLIFVTKDKQTLSSYELEVLVPLEFIHNIFLIGYYDVQFIDNWNKPFIAFKSFDIDYGKYLVHSPICLINFKD